MRQNLDKCFLGAADTWYTHELSYLSRLGLQNDPDGVKEWCDALEARFRDSPGKSLSVLESVRYGIKEVRARKDPVDFMTTIILNGQNSGIATTDAAQVLLAYEHIDGVLRRDLPRPTAATTVASMIEELRHQKDIWFDIYAGKAHDQSSRLDESKDRQDRNNRQGQGQYNNPFRPNFRPFNGGNNPRQYGNNPFYKPFVPYQNNSNTQFQQQEVQTRQLPGGRQQLQITNGNAPPGTTGQQQRQGRQNTGPRYNSNPFRPYRPGMTARAYQNYGEAEAQLDEQEQYEQYEDTFYQGVQWSDENRNPAGDEDNIPASPQDGPDDTVESHFISSAKTKPTCRKCHEAFDSNNCLHRHLRARCNIPSSTGANIPSSTVAEPTIVAEAASTTDAAGTKLIKSTASDTWTEGYAFRGYRFATAEISLRLHGKLHSLCLDSGCTMSLIDRQFLLREVKNVVIKKMPTPMNVRGIGNKKHDASEYTQVQFFFYTAKGVAIIEREVHIIDDLAANVLIGIDIMMPESIVLDFAQSTATIGSCNSLTIPVSVTTKGARTSRTVYSKSHVSIPPHTNVAVPISGPFHQDVDLPAGRDLMFEPAAQSTLSVYAHVVDHNMSTVFVRNDTDQPIVLPRNSRLGSVTEYEAEGCFSVQTENHNLAVKAPIRQPNFFKAHLKQLIASVAAFSAAISPTVTEVVHPSGVTVHGSAADRAPITALVDEFPTL